MTKMMAFLDDNNLVTNIAIFNDDQPETDTLKTYSDERPAGIGWAYDPERDAFIAPQPFESWILNEDSYQWEAPIPMPQETDDDGNYVPYDWDEDAGDWIEVTNETA